MSREIASFDALADVTEATDGLTPSEMRRVATFARGLRTDRRRTTPVGRDVVEASDWRDDVLPVLRHLRRLLRHADTLVEVSALVEQFAASSEADPETAEAGPFLRAMARDTFSVAEAFAVVDEGELAGLLSALLSTYPGLPATSPDAPT